MVLRIVNKIKVFDLGCRYKTKLKDNWIYIKFETTKYCNFACSYCCANAPKIENHNMEYTKENFENVIEFLKAQESDGIIFEFFGGEPTLNLNLLHFIERLKTEFKNIVILLLTNLSKPIEYYKTLPTDLHICTGYHSQFNNIEKYIEKGILIKEHFDCFTSIVLANRSNESYIFDNAKMMMEAGLNISLQSIIQQSEYFYNKYSVNHKKDGNIEYNINYDIKVANAYDMEGNEITDPENYENFKGLICYPTIEIMHDGSIRQCCMNNNYNIHKCIKKIKKYTLCHRSYCEECNRSNPKYNVIFFKQLGKLTK